MFYAPVYHRLGMEVTYGLTYANSLVFNGPSFEDLPHHGHFIPPTSVYGPLL